MVLFLKARHIKLAPVRDRTNATLQHYFDLSLDCNLDLALAWPISLFKSWGRGTSYKPEGYLWNIFWV